MVSTIVLPSPPFCRLLSSSLGRSSTKPSDAKPSSSPATQLQLSSNLCHTLHRPVAATTAASPKSNHSLPSKAYHSLLSPTGSMKASNRPTTWTSSIGMLKRLQTVALYTSLLSGPIPEEVGNCSKLQNLYLYQNSVTSPIPKRIGELTSTVVSNTFCDSSKSKKCLLLRCCRFRSRRLPSLSAANQKLDISDIHARTEYAFSVHRG
ncbi:hypothetical protein PS1_015846 [Malus domestica]